MLVIWWYLLSLGLGLLCGVVCGLWVVTCSAGLFVWFVLWYGAWVG